MGHTVWGNTVLLWDGVRCTPHLGTHLHDLDAQGNFFLLTQETCAVRAEPLLLVRINASGGLILRMGAINRCLKHPLARDTPVCLLAVLGEQHSGKTFLLNHLLRGLPSLVRAGLGQGAGEEQVRGLSLALGGEWGLDGPTDALFSAFQESGEGGWPRGGGSLQGFRWGANSLTRGIWMWSHPFLLGKEGRKVRDIKGRGGEDCGRGGGWRGWDMQRAEMKGKGMEKESFGGRTGRRGWAKAGLGGARGGVRQV